MTAVSLGLLCTAAQVVHCNTPVIEGMPLGCALHCHLLVVILLPFSLPLSFMQYIWNKMLGIKW